MSKKYGIVITEATLALIEVLNGGVRPLIEEERTYFLFETDSKDTTTNPDIKSEDDLYDDKGYLKDTDRTLLFG